MISKYGSVTKCITRKRITTKRIKRQNIYVLCNDKRYKETKHMMTKRIKRLNV
jgi:hypothetical protein